MESLENVEHAQKGISLASSIRVAYWVVRRLAILSVITNRWCPLLLGMCVMCDWGVVLVTMSLKSQVRLLSQSPPPPRQSPTACIVCVPVLWHTCYH